MRPTPRVALILLLSINLMNYVDRQILAALEEPIGREYGVGPETTGWLPFAFLVSYMVLAPVFGLLADRMSRWAIVGGGVILWSLASGGSGAVQTFGLLVLMRVLIGIGEAAYGPVAPTLIADLYPVASRGRVLSWFYAAIPVGSALGYVVGGLFTQHWHWAFYLTVPPGVALGVWALMTRDPQHEARRRAIPIPPEIDATARAVNSGNPTTTATTSPESAARPTASTDSSFADAPPAADPPHRAARHDYAALLRNRSYVLVTVGMTAMTFAVGGIAFFMPRWIKARLLLDSAATRPADLVSAEQHAAMLGTLGLGAITVVAGLLATLAGGWLGDRLRPRFAGSYFLVSGLAMLLAFPLFLLLFVTPFPLCWAVLFATIFCLFFNTGPTNAIIANVTPPGVRATAFAANIFVIHLLGDAISPKIIGEVAARFGGLDRGFLVVGMAILVGGVAWLAGTPFLARDTAAAERHAANEVV